MYLRKYLAVCYLMICLLLPVVARSGTGDSITVYLFLLDECRICQETAPEINRIWSKYKDKAGFTGIFPNFSSKPAGITSFAKKYGIGFDTRTDYFKKQVKRFSVTVLPEVVVYNETLAKIIYRGSVSDLYYSPGKRKQAPAKHFLMDALDQWFSGQAISVAETRPVGCFINMNDIVY